MFKIRMGIPEMQNFWDDLKKKVDNGTANTKSNSYKKIRLSDMK